MTAAFKRRSMLVSNTLEIVERLTADEVKACLMTAIYRLPTTTAERLCRELQITIYDRAIIEIRDAKR